MTDSNYFIGKTSRVEAFERDMEAGETDKAVLPTSCTVVVYRNKLGELLSFTSSALKRGAGVKVQLEEFRAKPHRKGSWFFRYDPSKKDFDNLNSLPVTIRKRYLENDLPIANAEIILVADSLETSDGFYVSIQESWRLFLQALEQGKTPIVDLSRLREAGTPSSNNLIATGALGSGNLDPEEGSFVSIYDFIYRHFTNGDIISLMQLLGQTNSCIRQGRKEKTGIVCTGLHYKHPDIKTYLLFPLSLLVGSQKKAVRIDSGILEDKELLNLLIDKCNNESVFLEKTDRENEDGEGRKLYSNVCVEILLEDKATCLLTHVQGGALREPNDIVTALCTTTSYLVKMWQTWRDKVKADWLYTSKEHDKQIGVGWFGFANYLAYEGVSFKDHAYALKAVLDEKELGIPVLFQLKQTKAYRIAYNLLFGYKMAAQIAESAGLLRAFTMAPTQSVSFNPKYKDASGNALSKSIDPPFVRRTKRDSERTGAKWYNYGKNIETIADVGSDIHELMWNQWQRLLNTTGLAHTMSYDLWHTVDEDWFKWFLNADPKHPKGECYLQTTYYNMAYALDQSYLNKGSSMTGVDVDYVTCDLSSKSEISCGCAD